MPVEIKELIIRAVAGTEQPDSPTPPLLQLPTIDKEALIQECVREIMRILQKKKER